MNKPIDTERRLVAIFAADVEGYSRLMGTDEVGTLRDLTLRRGVLDELITSHRGRIANTAGDSVLAEFGSAVDAVQCAVEAQEALAEANVTLSPERHINFRIGVHVGDVMVKGGDLFGDGVNIAARLQTLASAGGTCISGAAHDQVRKILPFAFTDLGAQQVKNIEEPVRTFAVSAKGGSAIAGYSVASVPLALPDKPSIAVLPFQNMSGDPEQEYFADGMVEEIITALSRFKSLFVIARTSSFVYKGKSVDIKRVGRELGVRYVLEGSVRKAAGKVRITAQLIEAGTNSHLWADKFDGKLKDIFALQDEITQKVVSAIEPKLKLTEIELAARRRPENLSAYDLYLRALPRFYSMTREGLTEALELFHRALEIEPGFCAAASSASVCYGYKAAQGWAIDSKRESAEALRLGRLALTIDPNDSDTLSAVGRVTAYLLADYETAIDMVDRAVALNSNSALSWEQRGWTYQYAARPETAFESFKYAIRLNPLDPMLYATLTGLGLALIDLGRFDEAIAAAKKAILQNPAYMTAHRCLVAALGLIGDRAQASKAVAHLLDIEPHSRISDWLGRSHRWQSDRLIEGLRLAGLPE